jgi:hypothetical protein
VSENAQGLGENYISDLAPAIKVLADAYVKVSIQFVNEAAPVIQGVLSFIDHLNAAIAEERSYLDGWENEGGSLATEF